MTWSIFLGYSLHDPWAASWIDTDGSRVPSSTDPYNQTGEIALLAAPHHTTAHSRAIKFPLPSHGGGRFGSHGGGAVPGRRSGRRQECRRGNLPAPLTRSPSPSSRLSSQLWIRDFFSSHSSTDLCVRLGRSSARASTSPRMWSTRARSLLTPLPLFPPYTSCYSHPFFEGELLLAFNWTEIWS
jgi:hypothetical protein